MILVINKNSVPLWDEEYLEYHDGKEGFPLNLDCSICGIQNKDRAEILKSRLTEVYPYKRYKLEEPRILTSSNGTFELLFAMSDFAPIITD